MDAEKEKVSQKSPKQNDLDSSMSSFSYHSNSKDKENSRSRSRSQNSSSSSWSLDKKKDQKKATIKEELNSISDTKENLNKKRKRSSSKKTNIISDPKKYNDYKEKVSVPGFDGPLITESLFKKLQHDSIPDEVVNETYKDYKQKYERKKYESFYLEHGNDEWFKEKYSPDIYSNVFLQVQNSCKKLLEEFKENLNDYKTNVNFNYQNNIVFKNTKYEKFMFKSNNDDNNTKNGYNTSNVNNPNTKYNKIDDDFNFKYEPIKNNKEDIKDITQAPYYGFDPDKNTLFFHQIPKSISKLQIYEIFQKAPGYLYITLSEPVKTQNYNRYCWITFNSEDNANKSYDLLKEYKIDNNYRLAPIKSKRDDEKIIRVSPSLYENRINEDLINTQKIIKILDKDKQLQTLDIFNNNDIYTNTNQNEKIKQLDLQILYLRKVHGFCFYCLEYFQDERSLGIKCDHTHLRFKFIGQREKDVEDNNQNQNDIYLYDKLLTEKINKFIEKGKVEHSVNFYDINEDENLKTLQKNFAYDNYTKAAAERFQCDLCSKLFIGIEFVIKHILNKHTDIINEKVNQKYFEKMKKDNYLNDDSKNYEKIKVINDMDDYFNYLNAMKKYQNYDLSGRKYYNREYRDKDLYNKYNKKYRNFRDYDDGDKRYEHSSSKGERKLVSYEDL